MLLVFENSPIPLRDWVYAFARMCSSKKGVSAHQIHRELDVTYKTAWFMCHRIRHAMGDINSPKLAGIVEVDETYIGGKYRGRDGRGHKNKLKRRAAVVAMVQRGGNVRVSHIPAVTSATLRDEIKRNVDLSSTLMTDEDKRYIKIGREFEGGHHRVRHSAGEYARGDAHSNTVEGFFSLLKRGVYGTFHHVSKYHLQRYCNEFAFRWDHRRISDVERTIEAIRRVDGRRLTYKQAG